MAIATLTVDLVAKLANIERDLGRASHLAEQNARKMQDAFDGVSSTIRGLAASLTGLFSAGAAVQFFNASVDAMGALDDMAEKTGGSVEKLSALVNVAKIGGHDVGLLESSILRLNKALAGGDDEAKGAGEALKALGLNAAELRALDPAEAYKRVADALAGFADGGEKSALAMQLLGKSGAAALPLLNDVAGAGELVATVTAKQAAAAEAYQKQLGGLRVELQNAAQAMSSAMVPALTELIQELVEGTRIAGGFWEAIKLFGTTSPFGTLEGHIRNARAELEKLRMETAAGVAQNIKDGGATDLSDQFAQIDKLEKRYQYLLFLQRRAATGGDPGANEDARDIRLREKPRLPNLGGTVAGADKSVKDREDAALNRFLKKGDESLMDEFLRTGGEETMRIETQKRIEQLEKDHARRIASIIGDTEAGKLEVRRQSMTEAAALFQEGALTEQQWLEYAAAQSEKFADKTKDAFDELGRTIEGWGKKSAGAIVDFAFGAELSIGGMVDAIMRDIARMLVYENVTQPLFNSLSSSVKSSGGLGNFAASIFSGFKLPSFAVGTDYVPYDMIAQIHKGERIVPAAQNTGGGTTVVVNLIEDKSRAGQVQQRSDGGANVLDVFVDRIRAAVAGDIARGSGPIPAALGSTYGLNRAAGGF